MARPEHPKRAEGVALLAMGHEPRAIAEKLGVPIETVRTWKKQARKPETTVSHVVRAVAAADPRNRFRAKFERLLDSMLDAGIHVSDFLAGKVESKYLHNQTIDNVAQFLYSNNDRAVKVGKMLEESEEEEPLDVEGRDITEPPALGDGR